MPVFLPGLMGGFGYGGNAYGFSPYGSAAHPRLPVPPGGGYGGAAYGLSSYGSVDITPPRVTGANPIDGFTVEVLFSEEMAHDSHLFLSTNYTFGATYGVPLTTVSVEGGTPGSHGGFTSVIITHTGTTLGGLYLLTVNDGLTGPRDLAGNIVGPPPTNSASFSAYGDPTTFKVEVPPNNDDGHTVLLEFFDSRQQFQPLLPEAEFTPGVDDTVSYSLDTEYPVVPTINSAEQVTALPAKVFLDISPMTKTTYGLTVGPARALTYKAAVLPDVDPDFDGVEVGTGTSTLGEGQLLLTKDQGVTYGWSFGDTSGRLVGGTSFRADINFDAGSAAIYPPMSSSSLFSFTVNDGQRQVTLTLADIAGTKVIDISTPLGAIGSVPAEWGEVGTSDTLSLVRNQKGAFYSVLFNGVPLLTFPVGGVTPTTIPVGVQALLLSAHKVGLFKIAYLGVSASTTVFTDTWNFIHDLAGIFVGSGVLARDRILTDRGPLVRGWGDATPATKDEVAVWVEGVEVEVADVNPYVGEIYPAIPIPLSAPGTVSVALDYIWFSNPPMKMEGLNTRGLTLNKWDRSVGHTPGALAPLPASSMGAFRHHRFPMGTALGPVARKSPKQIGHRYMGFQLGGYSALLNQPTTLLTNQNPHELSVGGLKAQSQATSVLFDGETSPTNASTPWVLHGVDSGAVSANSTYTLVDASAGSYATGTAAFYEQNIDLSLDCHVELGLRLKVDDSAGTYDGVFSGIACGIHDGLHLLMVGFLKIDGVRSLGLLKNASRPDFEESWEVGPSVSGTATTETTIDVPYDPMLNGIKSGSKVRIPSGPQTGVYTIAECGLYLNDLGTVTLVLEEALPEPVHLLGNDTVDLLFDVPWNEEFVSLRSVSLFPAGTASVSIGGSVSGPLAENFEVTAYPADTALLIPAVPKGPQNGVVFWGSVSRPAINTSVWETVQYSVIPKYLVEASHGITVLTEMGVVPEEDMNTPWFIAGGFGLSRVDSTGDTLLLKSTSCTTPPLGEAPLTFSYNRAVPYLSPKVRTEVEATFQVDSSIRGSGSASLLIEDTEKMAEATTLFFREGSVAGVAGDFRTLLDLPFCSLSGLLDPETAGWAPFSWNSGINTAVPYGQRLVVSQGGIGGSQWQQEATLDAATTLFCITEGVIFEATVKVLATTPDLGKAGPSFGGLVPWGGGHSQVMLDFLSDGFVGLIRTSDAAILASFYVGWEDGTEQFYRLVCDPSANLVVLSVNDTVVGTVSLSSFTIVPDLDPLMFRTVFGVVGSAVSLSSWDGVSGVPLKVRGRAEGDITLKRTLGIYLGGGREDINHYRIPRSDSSTAANSSSSAQPIEMDWTNPLRVRLYHDPEWGVCLYRPDLPPPPWHTGDFATETTDPSAAWISVESADLPFHSTLKGAIRWGSVNPRSITQQRWDSVRYRLRGAPDGFGIAPQNMLLNRSHRMTSGEFLYDTTPEVVTVNSAGAREVNVRACGIYADRVFSVQVDGALLPFADWNFDSDTQLLVLRTALPSDTYPVTVTFAAAHPITETYLCSQPIEGSVTLLNEGTPPIPKSLDTASIREILAGSRLNDPLDVLDDAETLIINDPHRVIKFRETETSLYTDLTFCEVEDGENIWISTLCDGPGIGEGFSDIKIEGTDYANSFSVPEGPVGPWGKSSPTIKGSATHFDQSSVLLASGGVIQGGVLGPGTAVLHPNARGPSGKPPPGMGLNQDFRIVLSAQAVLTDATVDPPVEQALEERFDTQRPMGDNVPPTEALPVSSNPDGVPGLHNLGKCVARLEDYGSDTSTSRLGPWGAKTWFGEVTVLDNAAILDGDTITIAGLPLTARMFAPPGGTDEFQIGIDAAETVANIRDAINDTSNSFVGLCHSQVESLPITNQANISSSRELTFVLSNGAAFRPNPRTGLFSKRSLLGGGAQLDGYQFILGGGVALPSPTVTEFTIEATPPP